MTADTSALPSGLVTFLMTDVEGSTELLRRLGRERFAALVDAHRAILTDAVQAFGGCHVDSQADSTFSVFERPSDAVRAAAAAQRALAAADWLKDFEQPVRVHQVIEAGDHLVAASPPRRISVLIVDDQALVRTGFRMILEAEPDVDVVGEAGDGVEALTLARRFRPDVVLMDVRMPNLDGIEATRRLLATDDVTSKVVMLTTFDMDEYVYEALHAGASGFLLKDVPPEQLVVGIRSVASGDALLAPSITRRVIEEFVRKPPETAKSPPPELEELTARESDVLLLIARGLSNAEIAKELWVSETTVKTHVARVLGKLRLRDRVQAVVFAYESGVVTAGESTSA